MLDTDYTLITRKNGGLDSVIYFMKTPETSETSETDVYFVGELEHNRLVAEHSKNQSDTPLVFTEVKIFEEVDGVVVSSDKSVRYHMNSDLNEGP